MAEKQAAPAPKERHLSGLLKTLLGGFAGVLSGALVMYLSPLLDKAIRPEKPVANFAVDAQGLRITVHNRSFGSGSGWWDFGDGSPLEPFVAGQDVVAHTYAAAGDYTVKLTLRNGLGEENDRAVPVRLSPPAADPPRIEGLDIVPVSPGSYAPATFRLSCRIKNAQLCAWDLGDGRPLDFIPDPQSPQERLVTFDRPGGYVVKVAAVSGTKTAQKSEIINVIDAPSGTVTAMLKLTESGTRVETLRLSYPFAETFPPERKEGVFPFTKMVPARTGYEIVDVLFAGPGGREVGLGAKGETTLDIGPEGRNLRLQRAPDRRSVRLTGELVRDPRKKEPPRFVVPVILVQQRKEPAAQARPVMATLAVPGSVTLPLPSTPTGWTDVKRGFRFELRDGDAVIYKEGDLPRGAVVTLRGRRCLLTALAAGDQVRVDLIDLPRGL